MPLFLNHTVQTLSPCGKTDAMKVLLHSVSLLLIVPAMDASAQPRGGYGRPAMERRTSLQAEAAPQMPQTPAKVEPQYRFPLTITMTATGYAQGVPREESVNIFYLNPERGWMAMPTGEVVGRSTKRSTPTSSGLLVYDLGSSTMLVLNTRAKSGMAVHLAALASKQAERSRGRNLPVPGDSGCTCSPTGRKKSISGYQTAEYACVGRNGANRHDIWITRDINVDLAPPGSQRSALSGFFHSASRLGGVPLEGYYYVNGALQSSLLVTEINRAAQVLVNTGEYNLNMR